MALMTRLERLRAAGVPQGDALAPIQSRSGGMSLCLWKVCPAAPWLIQK